MEGLYTGNFIDANDVFESFRVPEVFQEGVNIIYANYYTGGWEGDAQVLFERGGKLYEVHGSHCSCYGLEDQWLPKEVSARDWLAQSYGKEADAHVRLWCMIHGHAIVAD